MVLLSLCCLLSLLSCETSPVNTEVPIGLSSQDIDPSKVKLVIDKSDYELNFFYEDEWVKTYPVVFGGNPTDDKLMQGDQCTPEGQFGIRDLYPHNKWTYFVWIDYPNPESWVKYNAAVERGDIASGVDIGGEIGIHGVPEGYDHVIGERQNWTLGCISLTTKDIQEIFPLLSTKSIVEIRK